MEEGTGNLKVIDSHLHVWSNGQSPFPYAAGQEPPEQMQSNCGAEDLLERMSEARVSGSLIVQPINHKFDHSYVKSVIDQHPNKFKGMCLANPSLSPDEAVANIQDLHGQGFVGIRFNPYLWPDNGKMSNEAGSMMFAKAAELGMPVGIMCFKGLDLHFDDIKTLLEGTPETKVILDHFGFFMQQAKDIESDDKIFAQLLELSNYPQVYVKTSAYFRNSRGGNGWPYADLAPRLEALLEHYGSERLLWGSDYPFVKNECGYKESLAALFKWREESTDLQDKLTDSELENIFYGTATKLFGSWGG